MGLSILVSFVFGLAGSTTCVHALAVVTPAPHLPTTLLAQPRDEATAPSTCGYLAGDSSNPWTAPKGFDCRIDGRNGIWGVCPIGVADNDCDLGAYCFDAGPCSTGCGRASLANDWTVNTRTCPEGDNADAKFCSIGHLIVNPGVSYEYIDCALSSGEATYLLMATAFLTATAAVPSSSSSRFDRPTAEVTGDPSPPSSGSGPAGPNSVQVGPSSTDSGNASGGASNGDNNTGAIVGGILGGLALVLGSVIALVYLLRNNCTRHPQGVPEMNGTGPRMHQAMAHTPETGWNHLSGGWGPRELASDGGRGELPGNHTPLATTVPVWK